VFAILVDIVKKTLRSVLARKAVAPMAALDTTIKDGIARLHSESRDTARTLNPKRPGGFCLEAQGQTHADLAGGAIAMLCENVVVRVHAHIGVSRVQLKAAKELDARLKCQEESLDAGFPVL